jgi:uncharacterized protein (TIGR00369 family)
MPAGGVSRAEIEEIIAVSFFRSVLGGEVAAYGDGQCELRAPIPAALRQFRGDVHGGIVGALADDACAWACASVAGKLVTASYTINFTGRASGAELVARGQVLKTGRRLVVGQSTVYSIEDGREAPVAVLQATLALVGDTAEAAPPRLASRPD